MAGLQQQLCTLQSDYEICMCPRIVFFSFIPQLLFCFLRKRKHSELGVTLNPEETMSGSLQPPSTKLHTAPNAKAKQKHSEPTRLQRHRPCLTP